MQRAGVLQTVLTYAVLMGLVRGGACDAGDAGDVRRADLSA